MLVTVRDRVGGEPRWASAPGDTICRVLEAKGLTTEDLADCLGISDPDARRLAGGEMAVDAEIAAALARLLGSTPDFWMRREEQYRASLRWLGADELARRSPIAEMVRFGWLQSEAGWKDQAASLLSYFDVSDAAQWDRTWASRLGEALYRTSPSFASNEMSVAVWLRRAEVEASRQSLQVWSPSRLREAVPRIRQLSKVGDPSRFLPRIAELLAAAGVALVVLRAPSENRLSGAAFKLGESARAIALTGRHLAEDHLWFTLFHEIGHLLLHDGEGDFLDALDADDAKYSATEEEANDFARTTLFPSGIEALATSRASGPTKRQVVAFAATCGVAPGVVVGRLHHDGVLAYNQLNGLVRRYRWRDQTLSLRT